MFEQAVLLLGHFVPFLEVLPPNFSNLVQIKLKFQLINILLTKASCKLLKIDFFVDFVQGQFTP